MSETSIIAVTNLFLPSNKNSFSRCHICGDYNRLQPGRRICNSCRNDGFTADNLPAKEKTGQILVLGVWWYAPGVPREDYRDFLGRRFQLATIVPTIAAGCMPPGMVLEIDGRQYVVHGKYEQKGWLLPMGRI